MKVIGYVRVSTDEQADKGVSLDAQTEKIRQWASLGNHEVVDILSDEGISGKAMHNRPGLISAVEQAIETKGVLVVYSLSRMSRSTADTIRVADQLAAGGAEFVSITEQFDTTTAMGRAFYKIIAVLAELEREQIADRTREAMAFKRKNGEALGNTPFGFRNESPGESGGLLVPADGELPTLRQLLLLANNGTQRSYAQIARELNAAGYTTRRGSTWDRGTVRRICRYYITPAGARLVEGVQHIEGGARAARPSPPTEQKETA